MARLVIKGHTVRGDEVVGILGMLGGVDVGYSGFSSQYYFYIDEYGNVTGTTVVPDSKTSVIYTLEEFLEKFPYKVGETVVVSETRKVVTIEDMSWRNGREVIYETLYEGECFECFSAAELQPYVQPNEEKEETSEEIKIDIPSGYEFAGIDDDNQKVVFTKIQLQYPKTYEECCDILGLASYKSLTLINVTDEEDSLYINYIKLIRCRNAYWKLAGEQMGLGKPWEPDFKNDRDKYFICYVKDEIWKSNIIDCNRVLVFPTVEMSDMFYKNFKDTIEICKSLL